VTQILTATDVALGLVGAGFTGWQVVTMGAICVPESGRDVHAFHFNDHNPTKASYLSFGWGLFGINDYHTTKLLVTKGVITLNRPLSQQLFNPTTNFRAAREVLLEGGYQRWNTWLDGLHIPYLHECRIAARMIGVPV
jgi:hypothetical protein